MPTHAGDRKEALGHFWHPSGRYSAIPVILGGPVKLREARGWAITVYGACTWCGQHYEVGAPDRGKGGAPSSVVAEYGRRRCGDSSTSSRPKYVVPST